MSNNTTLDEFVRTFEILDDRMVARQEQRHGDITPLLIAPWNADDLSRWRPIQLRAPEGARERFYSRMPGKLPSLYEELVLSYVWAEVDLGRLRLIENLPPNPESLLGAIKADAILFDVLTKGRLLQFGKAPDMNYDPVCFDLSRQDSNGDCPVVRLDHEAILNDGRLLNVNELASTFSELVRLIVQDSRQRSSES